MIAEADDVLRPETWPEIREALASTTDWSGSLGGHLFRQGLDSPWWLCRVMLESLPPQCEDPLELDGEPVIVGRSPNLFDRFGDVWVSKEFVRIDGTFQVASQRFSEDPLGRSATDDQEFSDFDVSLPLPLPGETVSNFSLLGPIWLVRHADGELSALPGWVPGGEAADEYGIEGIGELVAWSASTRSFRAGARHWDEWGRSFDESVGSLGGYAATSDGDRVLVIRSDVAPSAPVSGTAPVGTDFELPELSQSVPLGTANLPIGWTVVDAVLHFRDGTALLCDIDPTRSVADLELCGDPSSVESGAAHPGHANAARDDLFIWMFGPVVYRATDGDVTVIPVGSTVARHAELPADQIEVVIEYARVECAYGGGVAVDIALTTTWPAEVLIRVLVNGELVVEERWFLEPYQLQGVWLPKSPEGLVITAESPEGEVVIVSAAEPQVEMARVEFDPSRQC